VRGMFGAPPILFRELTNEGDVKLKNEKTKYREKKEGDLNQRGIEERNSRKRMRDQYCNVAAYRFNIRAGFSRSENGAWITCRFIRPTCIISRLSKVGS
jgi:hypothetical protein